MKFEYPTPGNPWNFDEMYAWVKEMERRAWAVAINHDPGKGRFLSRDYADYHANPSDVTFKNYSLSTMGVGASITLHATHTTGLAFSSEDSSIQSLIAKAGTPHQALSTFHIAKVTVGTGYSAPAVAANGQTGLEGVKQCLASQLRHWLEPCDMIGGFDAYLYPLSGTVAVSSIGVNAWHRDARVDGVVINEIGPATAILPLGEWTHWAMAERSSYDHIWNLGVYSNEGAEFLLAWPNFNSAGVCPPALPKFPKP